MSVFLQRLAGVIFVEEADEAESTVTSIANVSGDVDVSDLSISLEHFVQVFLPTPSPNPSVSH